MTQHFKATLSNTVETRVSPAGKHSGADVTIQNLDASAYVFIGAEGVTTSDFGFRIAPGAAISFELPGTDALYAISDINGCEIAVLRTNLESGN